MTEAETETLMRSGVAHHVEGRLGEAQSVYLEVLQRQPEHAGALHLLGLIAFQSGEADKAVDLFDHAIAVRPDFPEAYDNRGTALYALGRYEDAVASYDRSIALKPGQAGPHANRGNALQTLHRGEEALTAFDTAIALDPEFADGFNNRAVTLMQLDRAQEALGSADEALRIMPGFAAAHTHRGNALHALGRLEEALVSHEAALRLHPDYAEAWCNRALALSDLGRHEAAAADHARAVALKPDFAIARFNLGIELLQLGRLEDGWDGYEWRGLAEAGMAPRTYPQPRWTGQEVRDRTVLVYHEQGLGDSIQFCRYAAMLAGRGARVVLAAPASLHPVLWTLEPRVRVIGQNDDPGPFDFYCPMASLPQSFGTRLDSIPAPARYLAADETSRAQWAVALGEKVRPRIGVVWGGSRLLKNDGRSILFDQFRSLISDVLVPGGADWICLQNQLWPADAEAAANGSGVRYVGDQLKSFGDTAALIEQMDLVVTVDTSVAHLAGAMGKPVWIMLMFNADWRWLLGRDDSPWYPSARLFRQAQPGDWTSVLEDVRQTLPKFLEGLG